MRLLDSDTCIHVMRGNGKVLQRLYECDSAELRFSVATLFEIFGGIVLSKPEHLADKERKLSKFRQLIQLAEFGPAEAYEAAKIKVELKGQLIGPYDLLIAATARVHGWTLATSNTREFSRVSDLRIEDWNE